MASASRSRSSRSLRHFAQAAHGQARTGERMTPDNFVGQAELQAELADFVLEQIAQRLDQLEAQILGQSADVVVQLDRRGGPIFGGAAFDHVRVERALGQEVGAVDLGGFVGKALDEGVADPLALLLRIAHAGQGGQELLLGLDDVQVRAEVIAELLDDFGFFIFAQQPVVDQDAGKLLADRLGQ